jgi:hypothetical protein
MEAAEDMKNLYSAIEPFTAKATISGREHKFLTGEDFICDPAKPGDIFMIEADEFFFFVERPIFQACCIFKGSSVA